MKNPLDKNFYELLELRPEASQQDIDDAFERLAVLYGPNSLVAYSLIDPAEAAELLTRAEAAYLTLSEPAARRAYDEELRRAESLPHAPRPLEIPPVAPVRVEEPMPEGVPEVVPDVVPVAVAAPTPTLAPSMPITEMPASSGPSEAAPSEESMGAPETRWIDDGSGASAPVFVSTPRGPSNEGLPKLGEDGVVTGEYLRQVREARGLGLRYVAEKTRIGLAHLQHIEEDRYDQLPAKVYLRGFLQLLARELHLDPEQISKSYMDVAYAGRLAKEREKETY